MDLHAHTGCREECAFRTCMRIHRLSCLLQPLYVSSGCLPAARVTAGLLVGGSIDRDALLSRGVSFGSAHAHGAAQFLR